jgi:hypothetical protein
MALNSNWLPVPKTPIITFKTRTVEAGDAFVDTAFKPGFRIFKF